ncbi:MAG: uracil-DNA glycosylase [Pseudorhodobacter sp.]
MGIDTNISDYDWHAALAALAWQAELGATEAMLETAIDRYALPERQENPLQKAKPPAAAAAAAAAPPEPPPQVDTALAAKSAAEACADLTALRAALGAFEHCELKKGARNLVFCDGNRNAPLMVVGEAPGREEDLEGRPFVGRAGQLLDKMLGAIGHSRTAQQADKAVYITNVLPWRPPGNRDPSEEEIAMLQPFLARHIALIKPRVIIALGNTSCTALLGQRGILRLRGTWAETQGIPVMPMAHPAYLLRIAAAKREAWADLLEVQARLAHQ